MPIFSTFQLFQLYEYEQVRVRILVVNILKYSCQYSYEYSNGDASQTNSTAPPLQTTRTVATSRYRTVECTRGPA